MVWHLTDSSEEINTQMKEQKEKIDGALGTFEYIAEVMKAILPKTEAMAIISGSNKRQKDSIKQSIEKVSYASQELAAASQEVAATAEEFNYSSENIQEVARGIDESTIELVKQIERFKI